MAGNESSGKLPKSDHGDFTYYGDNTFIDRIINEWEVKNRNHQASIRGKSGTVYKIINSINVNKKQYYVKQIIPDVYDFTNGVKKIINEISMSNILSALVPESISKLQGARVINSEIFNEASKKYDGLAKNNSSNFNSFIKPGLEAAYLIFEAHEGLTLDAAFKEIRSSNRDNTIESIKKRLQEYLSLICSARKALDSLNSAGYLHNDAHLRNIFVIEDNGSKKSILIDFGETAPITPNKDSTYTKDIKGFISKAIGYLFRQRILDEDGNLIAFETVSFKKFLSIQIKINGAPERDIYRNSVNDTILSEYLNEDVVINAILKLCEKPAFVEYSIFNDYANAMAIDTPPIPMIPVNKRVNVSANERVGRKAVLTSFPPPIYHEGVPYYSYANLNYTRGKLKKRGGYKRKTTYKINKKKKTRRC